MDKMINFIGAELELDSFNDFDSSASEWYTWL